MGDPQPSGLTFTYPCVQTREPAAPGDTPGPESLLLLLGPHPSWGKKWGVPSPHSLSWAAPEVRVAGPKPLPRRPWWPRPSQSSPTCVTSGEGPGRRVQEPDTPRAAGAQGQERLLGAAGLWAIWSAQPRAAGPWGHAGWAVFVSLLETSWYSPLRHLGRPLRWPPKPQATLTDLHLTDAPRRLGAAQWAWAAGRREGARGDGLCLRGPAL